MPGSLATLVNLKCYPIDEPMTGAAFSVRARDTFKKTGVLTLPQFLTPWGLALLTDEANRAAPNSYRQIKSHNVYLVADDPTVPAQHPARRRVETQTSTVADDKIPDDGGLRLIYCSRALQSFIARVLDKPDVFPYADPLASLNLGVTETGQQLNWHFDDADFATTLLIQSSESGGEFEFVPNLRGRDDEYETITRVLDGDRDPVQVLPLSPGTLVLFAGHHSLHRVAPVTGATTRLTAILSYAERPGVMLDPHTRKTFYGREQ